MSVNVVVSSIAIYPLANQIRQLPDIVDIDLRIVKQYAVFKTQSLARFNFFSNRIQARIYRINHLYVQIEGGFIKLESLNATPMNVYAR